MVSIGTTSYNESKIRADKFQSSVRELFLWTILLLAVPFVFGCGYGDKMPSRFLKIGGRANAFRLKVIEP